MKPWDGMHAEGFDPTDPEQFGQFAPDPPEPFDEGTLVDFELEIFASEPDAERYVADLVAAVTPVFG